MIIVLIILSLLANPADLSPQKAVNCTIMTEQGAIDVALYPDKAPVTVANFLKYVNAGLYTNSSFFRVCTPENEADRTIKIEVIQGGNIPEGSDLEPIDIETTQMSGLSHLDGTISMARDTPNSATSSFFICIGEQPELDYGGKRNPDGQGFAAFGQVTGGMEVVMAIQKGQNEDQMLTQPVKILNVRIN